ncbi:MFS transporter [Paenibacillus lentus]|uniref:MFS transporter n=1 Tax=Paenibacillus lentus TaxID=1338368 RepID=UPI001FE61646|nr:MFS transporter [Paenibacillus lentus]
MRSSTYLAGSRYAWFLLVYFWIYGFVGSINRFVQSYYQNEISHYLATGRSFLGTTWSINIIIGALCAPIGGYLIDKYGYKKVMMVSSLFAAGSVGTLLLFRNTIGYLVGFGILAGLVGIAASANYVFVSDWFINHRAKVLVILNSAASLGLAILSPVFILNESRFSWIHLYWVTFFSVSPLLFSLIFGASYLGALPGGILLANETLEKKNVSSGMLTGFLILTHQIGGAISGIAGGINFDLFTIINYLLDLI